MIETYSYSADGKRQRKVTAGGTTNSVWDGENLLLETDASLVPQGQYTHFPGEWGGLMSQRRGGVSSFHAFDLQSNTRALVSAAGAISDSYRYKAFGEELVVTGSSTNPHRYGGAVGYQRDTAARHYARARHLAVTTGRWTSRDPLELASGDGNLYRYVGNNPVNALDPTGKYLIDRASCSNADYYRLRSIITKVCGRITSRSGGSWNKAEKCVCGQSGGTLGGYQEDCFRKWCDEDDHTTKIYCDWTPNCISCISAVRDSGACVGPGATYNRPAHWQAICMNRVFLKNGRWNRRYGCSHQGNPARGDYYRRCPQGCAGQEDTFYLLHELMHVCGTPGGTSEGHADTKACCILNIG